MTLVLVEAPTIDLLPPLHFSIAGSLESATLESCGLVAAISMYSVHILVGGFF